MRCVTLSIFAFLTVTCSSTIHKERMLRFHYKNDCANAPKLYVIRALSLFFFCWNESRSALAAVAPPSQSFGVRFVTAMNANMAPGRYEAFTVRFPRRGTQ
jgi:hypothetical protein